MRVGFDVTPLGSAGDGIGRYTFELLAALWSESPAHDVVPLGNRRLDAHRLPADAPNATVGGPRFPSRAAWTFGLLPLWLPRAGLDVFHATGSYAPVGSGIPTVVTVHDLTAVTWPECHPRGRVLRARLALGRVARRAAAIIVPSEATRRDVMRWLAVPAERLHVIPGAPAAVFRPADERSAADVAGRYGLEPGFFLVLGTVEPRKNVARIIEAVARLRREGAPVRLAIVGRLGWKVGPILDQVAQLRRAGAVRLVGVVPDEDLPALMGAATALVYPSLAEGFGLPIVEAMASGLPVITADRGAVAETAGGAALLVDPLDPGAIAGAMRTVLDGPARARLRASGLRRAVDFSWQRAARETLAVYEAVGPAAGGRR